MSKTQQFAYKIYPNNFNKFTITYIEIVYLIFKIKLK